MTPLRPLLLFIGCLMLSGLVLSCSGLQKDPILKNYYDLSVKLFEASPEPDRPPPPLMVKEFSIDPAFDSHALVYRVGENEFVTDFYNEFISYPANLVTEKITEVLGLSGLFSLAPLPLNQDIPFRLSGRVAGLYGDFLDKTHPLAVFEIRVILEKKTDQGFETIFSRAYRRKIPIASIAPADLVSGWNNGFSEIANQFVADLRQEIQL